MIDHVFATVITVLSLLAIFGAGFVVGIGQPLALSVFLMCVGLLLQSLLHSGPTGPSGVDMP